MWGVRMDSFRTEGSTQVDEGFRKCRQGEWCSTRVTSIMKSHAPFKRPEWQSGLRCWDKHPTDENCPRLTTPNPHTPLEADSGGIIGIRKRFFALGFFSIISLAYF